MDPVESRRDSSRLVGLNAADEMPAQAKLRKGGYLGESLSQVILTKIPQAKLRCRKNSGDRLPLGDRQECDGVHIPARRLGCTCNTGAQCPEVGLQQLVR